MRYGNTGAHTHNTQLKRWHLLFESCCVRCSSIFNCYIWQEWKIIRRIRRGKRDGFHSFKSNRQRKSAVADQISGTRFNRMWFPWIESTKLFTSLVNLCLIHSPFVGNRVPFFLSLKVCIWNFVAEFGAWYAKGHGHCISMQNIRHYSFWWSSELSFNVPWIQPCFWLEKI